MDKPKVGIGVIVLKDSHLLLGKRKGSHGAGEWSLAGGHLEYGETIEACAARELKEETGLEALSFHLVGWTNDVITYNKHYITFFVQVDQFQGKEELKEPNKCEGWEWFPLNTLPTPLFPPLASFIQQGKLQPIRLSLSIMPDTFGICRLNATHPIPDWGCKGSFFSISKTSEELSIVCSETAIPKEIQVERGWRGIKVEGPLDFNLKGVLAGLSRPLADAGISIFVVSTFDTDYLLVKQEVMPKSIEILSKFCKINT